MGSLYKYNLNCKHTKKRSRKMVIGAMKKGARNKEKNWENKEQKWGKKLLNWAFLGCGNS